MVSAGLRPSGAPRHSHFRALLIVCNGVKNCNVQQNFNHFTRQYNPEDSSEHHTRRRENLKSHKISVCRKGKH
jgi:predicted metal-binding transcription factor (methanogenesis marker protein 9)